MSDPSDYTVVRTIARSPNSKVKLARVKATGDYVAVKIVDRGTEPMHEVYCLKTLCHSNILKVHAVLASHHHLYIITEYCAGGDLFSVVPHGGVNETTAKYFFRQIIEGVSYIHSHCIAHRDLKPDNILLDRSRSHVFISDFGFSAPGNVLLSDSCGTPYYVAPEVVSGRPYYGTPADIWSLGVILYFLLSGGLPFKGKTFNTLYGEIMSAKLSLKPTISVGARRLVRRMLDPCASTRLTVEEVRTHPWLVEETPTLRSVGSFGSLSSSRFASDVDETAEEPVVGLPPVDPERVRHDHALEIDVRR